MKALRRAKEETMFDPRMATVHAQARYNDLLHEAEVERQARKDRAEQVRRMLNLVNGLRASLSLKVH